jgi:hypothetical protein
MDTDGRRSFSFFRSRRWLRVVDFLRDHSLFRGCLLWFYPTLFMLQGSPKSIIPIQSIPTIHMTIHWIAEYVFNLVSTAWD